MATKKSTQDTKITRISASGKAASKKEKATPVTKATPGDEAPRKKRARRNTLRGIGAYFAGSWYELREVRWPTRRATWGMVGALLGFTGFFVVIVLLIDALFQWLFNLVLGS